MTQSSRGRAALTVCLVQIVLSHSIAVSDAFRWRGPSQDSQSDTSVTSVPDSSVSQGHSGVKFSSGVSGDGSRSGSTGGSATAGGLQRLSLNSALVDGVVTGAVGDGRIIRQLDNHNINNLKLSVNSNGTTHVAGTVILPVSGGAAESTVREGIGLHQSQAHPFRARFAPSPIRKRRVSASVSRPSPPDAAEFDALAAKIQKNTVYRVDYDSSHAAPTASTRISTQGRGRSSASTKALLSAEASLVFNFSAKADPAYSVRIGKIVIWVCFLVICNCE
jgi:hypothetical protein